MLSTLGSEHRLRHRRRWIAALSLCIVAGLQLAAVPPEVFADPGICFMECSVEGRSCCCKRLLGIEPPPPHAPEAAADGRLTTPRDTCRELCATFGSTAPGGDLWLSDGARNASTRPVGMDRIDPSAATLRRLEHSDPSTLPRPPPMPVTLL